MQKIIGKKARENSKKKKKTDLVRSASLSFKLRKC